MAEVSEFGLVSTALKPYLAPAILRLQFDGQTRHFCCPGCHAVAETIIEQGLADYYRFRTSPASKASPLPDKLQQQLQSYDNAEVLGDLSSRDGELATG